MTNVLKWRLGKLPSPLEVSTLVNDKIITKEEAREILFKTETEEDRDAEGLKSEIKFLRELVDKMAKHSSIKITEVIRDVYRPYKIWPWYQPYYTWTCGVQNQDSSTGLLTTIGNSTTTAGSNTVTLASNSFTDIKTF